MSHSHSSLSEHDLPHYVAPFPVHLHIPRLPLQSCGVNTHLIHGQQDGFVVWLTGCEPYDRGYFYSPTTKEDRFLLSGQFRGRHNYTCVFGSFVKDKAPEGWLHRCSCTREKQVQSLGEFITLHEKGLCHAHHTFQARGNLLPHTHTNGSRTET